MSNGEFIIRAFGDSQMDVSASQTKDKIRGIESPSSAAFPENKDIPKEEQIKSTFLELSRKYAKDGSCKCKIVRCLECGYAGEMPVCGKAQKSDLDGTANALSILFAVLIYYVSFPVFLLSYAACLLFGHIKSELSKVYVACPSCRKILGPVDGV